MQTLLRISRVFSALPDKARELIQPKLTKRILGVQTLETVTFKLCGITVRSVLDRWVEFS